MTQEPTNGELVAKLREKLEILDKKLLPEDIDPELLKDKIKKMQKLIENYQARERDLLKSSPYELDHLRNSMQSFLNIVEPHKLRMIAGMCYNIAETPEMAQLHVTNNELADHEIANKKELRKMWVTIITTIITLSAATALGLDADTIFRIFLEFIKYWFG